MTREQTAALIDCAELLKDIVNADPQYSEEELRRLILDTLDKVTKAGIELAGEDFLDEEARAYNETFLPASR